jgi:predicted CoA-substrate-specific enzyme activase
MLLVASVDVGSATTKSIILDEDRQVLGRAVTKTGSDLAGAARRAYDQALQSAGAAESDVTYVASTGFGRYTVPFRDVQITELTAHARGAVALFPNTRTVLDIGAQSTRAIRIAENGRVVTFRMNDKCAAGAGAFLVRAARYLELTIDEIGPLSCQSKSPQPISSVCAVLAESEIINHVTAGVAVEDILKGCHMSIVTRALPLLKRAGYELELTVTGGTGKNSGLVQAVAEALNTKVNVSPETELVGALGAALLALDRVQKLRAQGVHSGAAVA